MKLKRSQSGFTLLEVMIAVTILAVALSAILTSQSSSIATTLRTREINLASWLARNVMVESEHLYEGKPLNELPKLETKAFTAPFERFKWKREIKEIKFPDFNLPQKEGEGVPEPVRILTQTLTKYLNNSIREMQVTVSWPRGEGEQRVSVTTYLIDLNQEFNFAI